MRGDRPCDVRSNRVGDLRRVQPEERGLRTIDLHGELRTRLVAREAWIRNAGRRLEHVLNSSAMRASCFQVFAANLDAHARVVVLAARHQTG